MSSKEADTMTQRIRIKVPAFEIDRRAFNCSPYDPNYKTLSIDLGLC